MVEIASFERKGVLLLEVDLEKCTAKSNIITSIENPGGRFHGARIRSVIEQTLQKMIP